MYRSLRRPSHSHLSPDFASTPSVFAMALRCCTADTLWHFGRRLHCEMRDDPNLTPLLGLCDIEVALIAFYAKCGARSECMAVFEGRDNTGRVELCNAMLGAHARCGRVSEMHSLLNVMRKRELKPDAASFVAVLSGYAFAGRCDDALRLWRSGIERNVDRFHHSGVTAVVD